MANIDAPTNEERLDFLFRWLVELAKRNEKCPTRKQVAAVLTAAHYRPVVYCEHSPYIELANRGKIRFDIYGRNQTRITIMHGRFKGKATKALPDRWKKPVRSWGPNDPLALSDA